MTTPSIATHKATPSPYAFWLWPIRLWKWWFTPRATDRDEAFRERATRAVWLVLFLTSQIPATTSVIAGAFPVEGVIVGSTNLILALIFLLRGKLVPASLLTAVAPMIGLTTQALFPEIFGFHEPNIMFEAGALTLPALLNILLVIFMAAVLLPRSYPQFALIGLAFTWLLVALGQLFAWVNAGNPLPETAWTANLEPSVFYLVMVLVLIIVTLNALLKEHYDQRSELKVTNAALRESERTLEHRVVERTRELDEANEQLGDALEKAIEADNIKSQFLASMSHELRTPLNAVLTFNDLMAMGAFGPVNEEQSDYLQKSLNSGRHLLSLINDVLDMTKIMSGMMKLFIEDDFDISAELSDIVTVAEKMLDDKLVQIITDIDSDLPLFSCDKRRVRQVFFNLVSNAVKFTEQGTITISAKHKQDEILFVVSDTGPGVSPEEREYMFEPFVQTESGIRHAGGTGLGLPISQRMVQAHGGRLWFESEPGNGATFYAALPVNLNKAMFEEEVAHGS